MTNKDFTTVVNNLFTTCKETLTNKSKEYDFGEDRLHSFKTAAALLKTSPEEALLGYMTKHIMSIYDMGKCSDNFTKELWEEKIKDIINYCCLLYAIIDEKRCKETIGENKQTPMPKLDNVFLHT